MLLWGQGVARDEAGAQRSFEAACRMGFAGACDWKTLFAPDAPVACEARSGDGLEKDELTTVIVSHERQVRTCFEGALSDPHLPEGKLKLVWKVGALGQVTEALVSEDTLREVRVTDCLRQSVLGWRFPCPRGGGVVNVTFPYVFLVARDEE